MVALLSLLLLPLAEGPEPEDVKAGWVAFAVFAGLILAVVVLGFSLVKQLRKVETARKAGVYGDEPETDEAQANDVPANGVAADGDDRPRDA